MKRTIVTKGATLVFVFICACVTGVAQDKLRSVEQPAKFVYPNTPVEVVVNLDGKPMVNRQAQAGPDWLRRISLEITNTSGKDINLLWINLMLREPVYGAKVASAETACIVVTVELRHSAIKVVQAGDRITLAPPPPMIDLSTKIAREQGLDDIEKVILDIRQVGFTDNTVWTRGRVSRKDPETGRMVFVTEDPLPPILYLP